MSTPLFEDEDGKGEDDDEGEDETRGGPGDEVTERERKGEEETAWRPCS